MSQKLFVDKVTVMLRHYREAAGLSQSELAETLKIGLRSYQRYESGESVPSIDLVYLLSKALKFELKDLFSAHDLSLQIPGFKCFLKEEEKTFLDMPLVKDSGLFEMYNSPEFTKITETGDMKAIREYAPFKTSPFVLALSNPKQTILNPVAQKQTGFQSDSISTTSAHEDPRTLGIVWAHFMDSKCCFFEHEVSSPFPKGQAKMITRGIFSGQNNHYLILSVSEIIFPQKRG